MMTRKLEEWESVINNSCLQGHILAGSKNPNQSWNTNPCTPVWDVGISSSILVARPNAKPRHKHKKNSKRGPRKIIHAHQRKTEHISKWKCLFSSLGVFHFIKVLVWSHFCKWFQTKNHNFYQCKFIIMLIKW